MENKILMTLAICLRKLKNTKYFGNTSTTKSAIVGLLGNRTDAQDDSGVDTTITKIENTLEDVEKVRAKAGVEDLPDT